LDGVIRQAQHLLFNFDGPIRSADTGNPPAPYIHDALAACRESGRSAAIVTTTPLVEVRAYLEAHDLPPYSTVITPSIGEAASALDASPADCVMVTRTTSDLESAKSAGVPSIAYAKTYNEADHLIEAGAATFMHSMSDLVLSLRAHPLSS